MSKINYTLLENATESMAYIDKTVKGTFRKRDSLRKEIQQVLVAMAFHAYKHGDWTVVYKLCDPQTAGKDLHDGNSKIAKWVCKYLGLEILELKEVGKDGKEKKVLKFGNWKGAEYIKDHFNTSATELGAKDCMWWGFKESELKPYDVNDTLRAIAKTYAAKLEASKSPDYDQEHKAKIKLDVDRNVMAAFLSVMGIKTDKAGNIVFDTTPANNDVTVG